MNSFYTMPSPSDPSAFSADKAIHLCIDVQPFYLNIEDFAWGPQIKKNISVLVKGLGKRKVKNVFVVCHSRFTPFLNGVDIFKRIPEENKDILWMENGRYNFDFSLTPNQLVAFKRAQSAFEEKEIIRYMKACEHSTIILSGVYENKKGEPVDESCLSRTARDFAKAGYKVVVAHETTQLSVHGSPLYRPLDERIKRHKKLGVEMASISDILARFDITQAPQTLSPV